MNAHVPPKGLIAAAVALTHDEPQMIQVPTALKNKDRMGVESMGNASVDVPKATNITGSSVASPMNAGAPSAMTSSCNNKLTMICLLVIEMVLANVMGCVSVYLI